MPIAVLKIFVDRAGKDEFAKTDLVLDVFIFGIQKDSNVWMGKHVLEHARISAQRHGLEPVSEVAVIAAGSDGDARGDGGIQFRWIETPLLAGVVAEELFI